MREPHVLVVWEGRSKDPPTRLSATEFKTALSLRCCVRFKKVAAFPYGMFSARFIAIVASSGVYNRLLEKRDTVSTSSGSGHFVRPSMDSISIIRGSVLSSFFFDPSSFQPVLFLS